MADTPQEHPESFGCSGISHVRQVGDPVAASPISLGAMSLPIRRKSRIERDLMLLEVSRQAIDEELAYLRALQARRIS